MNILIAEDELYLAQSIKNSLSEQIKDSYIDTVTTANDALGLKKHYEIIILSITLNGNIYDVIEKYKNSTIILLVPYINHDTITLPLKAGADTYILKPFMIEELMRKIEHHLEFKQLKKEYNTLKDYFNICFKDIEDIEINIQNIEFPLFIKSKNRKKIDKLVFNISKKLNIPIAFYDLKDKCDFNKIEKENQLVYLLNFDTLKSNSMSKLFDVISNKKVIIALDNNSSFEHPNMIKIENDKEDVNDDNSILTVEDYIKHIIKTYESKFPDTELSKKLGISRKSLWEKRKKYGLNKKK
jgi:DNA-binding NtrC family response regulator